MKLTQFIRDRSDVELERLAREDTRWSWLDAHRDPDESYHDTPGCLLCNTFDLRSHGAYLETHDRFTRVEQSYIDLARRNGDDATGAMIARLARRELGRRAIEAIGELSPVEQEVTA